MAFEMLSEWIQVSDKRMEEGREWLRLIRFGHIKTDAPGAVVHLTSPAFCELIGTNNILSAKDLDAIQ